jgi:hypothetical protein
MAPQQQQQQDRNANGRAYDFTPVDFDGTTIEPDAHAGAYEGLIDAVKVSKTVNGSFPMVILEWKLLSTEDESEECQQSVNAVVADFLTFFPEGDRRGKMGKVKYRTLCDKLGLEYDIVPKKLKSKADFEAFIEAIKGKELPVWVTSKPDNKQPDIIRTGIEYDEPRGGSAQLAPLDEGGEGDEEERPARAAKSAKKTAQKSSRR